MVAMFGYIGMDRVISKLQLAILHRNYRKFHGNFPIISL